MIKFSCKVKLCRRIYRGDGLQAGDGRRGCEEPADGGGLGSGGFHGETEARSAAPSPRRPGQEGTRTTPGLTGLTVQGQAPAH